MDRFAALTTFVAVADQGGFARAARHLAMSPPAVTRTIAMLEQHLGVALFQRSTRSMTLTEDGAVLLERARDLLAQLHETEHIVMGGQSAPRGELHVTAPVVFGRMHVLPVLTALLAEYPEVTVRLMLVDRNIRIVEEGIDIAVRIGELRDSSLHAVAVGSVRQMIVASPAYCEHRGRPLHPQDLHGHDIIGGDNIRNGGQWRFGPTLDSVPISPRLSVNSIDAMLAAAVAGAGIAKVLSYQAAGAIAEGALCSLLDEYAPPSAPVSLLFHGSRARRPAVRQFIERMRERAKAGAWG